MNRFKRELKNLDAARKVLEQSREVVQNLIASTIVAAFESPVDKVAGNINAILAIAEDNISRLILVYYVRLMMKLIRKERRDRIIHGIEEILGPAFCIQVEELNDNHGAQMLKMVIEPNLECAVLMRVH